MVSGCNEWAAVARFENPGLMTGLDQRRGVPSERPAPFGEFLKVSTVLLANLYIHIVMGSLLFFTSIFMIF